MRKAMIAILVIAMATALSCQTTDSGSKSGSKKAPIKDGPGKIYWEGDGTLKGAGNFLKGKKEGEWTLYHRFSGEKLAQGLYKDNKQSGPWVFFHKNGQKLTEGEFDEDQRKGPWVEFYDTGQKKADMNYVVITKVLSYEGMEMTERMGVLHGDKKTFYPTGQVKREETYREGDLTGVIKEFYDDGRPKEISQYSSGKNDGQANTWWPTGKHKERGRYTRGNKTGPWMFYHGNGALHMKGSFQDNNMVGRWVYHSSENRLMKEGNYRIETVQVMKKASTRSTEDGYWTFYRLNNNRSEKFMEIMLSSGMIDGTKEARLYKDGKLDGKGAFQMGLPKAVFEVLVNGTPKEKILAAAVPPDDFANNITHRWTGEWEVPKKSGKWTFYFPNGKVMAEGEYMINKKNGEWKVYRPDGSLDAEQSGMYRFDRKSKF